MSDDVKAAMDAAYQAAEEHQRQFPHREVPDPRSGAEKLQPMPAPGRRA
jgi:hypothetical protein